MKFDRYEQTPDTFDVFTNIGRLADWEIETLHQQFNVNTCDVEDEFGDNYDDEPEDEEAAAEYFPQRYPEPHRSAIQRTARKNLDNPELLAFLIAQR